MLVAQDEGTEKTNETKTNESDHLPNSGRWKKWTKLEVARCKR